ncbi:hypothetical protein ACFQ1S_35070, partial [Kibdelosporangium lantanae]
VELAREVAFRVVRPGSATVAATLSVVEELLSDESAYEFVMTFLEQVQNLVSHGLPAFLPAEEVVRSLGPRSTTCWTTLADFWAAVERWCVDNDLPLKSSAEILGVENTRLRALLWTGNRSLPSGDKLGLAEAVRYEKGTGAGLPGFSHVAAALRQLPPNH